MDGPRSHRWEKQEFQLRKTLCGVNRGETLRNPLATRCGPRGNKTGRRDNSMTKKNPGVLKYDHLK